jgi:hypothetical protein
MQNVASLRMPQPLAYGRLLSISCCDSRRPFSSSFPQGDNRVWGPGELFFTAVGPKYMNRLDARLSPQPEVRARIAAGEVTVSRLEQTPKPAGASMHRNFGANGIPSPEGGIDSADDEPISRVRAHIAQQLRRTAGAGD